MDSNSNIDPEMTNLFQEREDPSMSILLYNEKVIDHFSNPRNVGELSEERANGFSITGDPACGDQLHLWLEIKSGTIKDIKFKTFGCPGAIATSSMMTVLAKGKTIEEAKKITDDEIIDALSGIPARKKHCSLLGVMALQNAIGDYEIRTKSGMENR